MIKMAFYLLPYLQYMYICMYVCMYVYQQIACCYSLVKLMKHGETLQNTNCENCENAKVETMLLQTHRDATVDNCHQSPVPSQKASG